MAITLESHDVVDLSDELDTGEPLGGDRAKHVAVRGAGGKATGARMGAITGGLAGTTVGSLHEGEAALRTDSGWKWTFESMRLEIKDSAVIVGVHRADEARHRQSLVSRQKAKSCPVLCLWG